MSKKIQKAYDMSVNVYDIDDIENMETGARKALEEIAQFFEIILCSYPTIWDYRSQEEKFWHLIRVVIDYARYKAGGIKPDKFAIQNMTFFRKLLECMPRGYPSKEDFYEILKKAYPEL